MKTIIFPLLFYWIECSSLICQSPDECPDLQKILHELDLGTLVNFISSHPKWKALATQTTTMATSTTMTTIVSTTATTVPMKKNHFERCTIPKCSIEIRIRLLSEDGDLNDLILMVEKGFNQSYLSKNIEKIELIEKSKVNFRLHLKGLRIPYSCNDFRVLIKHLISNGKLGRFVIDESLTDFSFLKSKKEEEPKKVVDYGIFRSPLFWSLLILGIVLFFWVAPIFFYHRFKKSWTRDEPVELDELEKFRRDLLEDEKFPLIFNCCSNKEDLETDGNRDEDDGFVNDIIGTFEALEANVGKIIGILINVEQKGNIPEIIVDLFKMKEMSKVFRQDLTKFRLKNSRSKNPRKTFDKGKGHVHGIAVFWSKIKTKIELDYYFPNYVHENLVAGLTNPLLRLKAAYCDKSERFPHYHFYRKKELSTIAEEAATAVLTEEKFEKNGRVSTGSLAYSNYCN